MRKLLSCLILLCISTPSSAHNDLSLLSEKNWGGSLFAQFGYYQDKRDLDNGSIPGFMTGGDSAPHQSGLQLFHSESEIMTW